MFKIFSETQAVESGTLSMKNYLIGSASVPYDQFAILRRTDTKSEREWEESKQK